MTVKLAQKRLVDGTGREEMKTRNILARSSLGKRREKERQGEIYLPLCTWLETESLRNRGLNTDHL